MTVFTDCPAGHECTGLYVTETAGFMTADVEAPDGWHVTVETHGRTGRTPVTRYHSCYPRADRTPRQQARLSPRTGSEFDRHVPYAVISYGGDAALGDVLHAHGVRLVETDLEGQRRLIPPPKPKGIWTPALGRPVYADEVIPEPAKAEAPVVWAAGTVVDPFAGHAYIERERIYF
ncbi:hypothetical protein AB2L57_10755 [Microbacterium sp. HA-8]|uniref:hypothetical protein n=1 Tax=Microbacterium sp. HA-8 TaxID=3234200 RepID=UPI0038F5ED6E